MKKPIEINVYEPDAEFLQTIEDLAKQMDRILRDSDCSVNHAHAALMLLLLRAIDNSENPDEALARTQMSLHIWGEENIHSELPEGITLQ